MNPRIIGIIIGREYLNRVKKKSFLVTTFVVPILMAALCIVPIVMMMNAKDKAKTIAVVDATTEVIPYLQNTETITYMDLSGMQIDSVKAVMADMGLAAVLSLSDWTEDGGVQADLTSLKPLGLETVENISHCVNDAVREHRIALYDDPDLKQKIDLVTSKVKVQTFLIDEEGNETVSEQGVYQMLSMLLGLVIFLFITLFGGMVMSAVIEEKTSRVVEVLVSSVKATELMFGKIIGIALVALTQFLLWIVLTLAIVTAVGSVIGLDSLTADPSAIAAVAGADASQVEAATGELAADGELGVILTTLGNLPVGSMIAVFLLFFVFGYILYASMYAAVGSAVENEGDSQQLQLPMTIPLMLAYFIAIYAFNAPESPLVWWGSMIPFTSPIVMLARLPFGVPAGEIVISIAVLVLTCAVFAWLSAKIYKVGILMFGKKSTWKDLWKWLKQK